MEAKLRSEEHESYQAYNGDECAKQHKVIRGCGIGLLYVNMEGKRYDLIPGGLMMDNDILVAANHKKSAEVVVARKLL